MAKTRQRLSPEARYIKDRNNSLRGKFGITLEEYNRMNEEQGGVCAICGGTNPSGRALAVDHDHTLGHVRMLLCSKCNTGIGQFNHSSVLMEKAVQYLRNHGE